jgi:predicted DNA-binding antitoxin AbrB/MazE fold protein
MSKAFNALYENGVFKPLGKVRLKNRQKVKLTVIETEKPSTRVAKLTRKPSAKTIGVDVSSHPAHQIVGLFRSGAHDLAKSHDRHLYR